MTSLARTVLTLGSLALLAALSPSKDGKEDERQEEERNEQGERVEPDDGDAQERPPHERIGLPSLAACGGCHEEVYAEWARSLHAGAWTNANVRQATWDFKKRACRACHSPMPVLPHSLEEAPEYRDFNQDDGVHCLSCHGLEDGVAAARSIEGAPCRPRFEPRLLDLPRRWSACSSSQQIRRRSRRAVR